MGVLISGGGNVSSAFAKPFPLGRVVPTPEECTIAPRSIDQLLAFSAEAEQPATRTIEEPTPLIVEANLVSAAEIFGVQATIHGIVACTNAGDQPRIYAYCSDEILRNRISVDPESLGAPAPLPEGEQMAILGVPYIALTCPPGVVQ